VLDEAVGGRAALAMLVDKVSEASAGELDALEAAHPSAPRGARLMTEAAFPVLGAAFVLLGVLPVFSLLAKGVLLAARA
jgi:hypothetical protein